MSTMLHVSFVDAADDETIIDTAVVPSVPNAGDRVILEASVSPGHENTWANDSDRYHEGVVERVGWRVETLYASEMREHVSVEVYLRLDANGGE